MNKLEFFRNYFFVALFCVSGRCLAGLFLTGIAAVGALAALLLTHVFFKNNFGSKSKLGDYVLMVVKIAIEGVVLGRNIDVILFSYSEPIILYVQAVCLKRLTIDVIILAAIMTVNSKAVLHGVSEVRLAELLEAIATWL